MEWLTGSDTCFLIGARCSACADKPLIGRLTEQILEVAEDKLLQQFRSLRQICDHPATIEDLINFLLRYRDILEATVDADAAAAGKEPNTCMAGYPRPAEPAPDRSPDRSGVSVRGCPGRRTVYRRSLHSASRSFSGEPGSASRIAASAPRTAWSRVPGASATFSLDTAIS